MQRKFRGARRALIYWVFFLIFVSIIGLVNQFVPRIFASTDAVTLTDSSDFSQRAVWWNRTWNYRVPVTITPTTTLYDKLVTFNVDWSSVFTSLGISTKTLDTNSLRVIEYSTGGHILYQNSITGVNRFSTLPVSSSGNNNSTIKFMMAGKTVANSTRHFFLYFDTTDNSKTAKDYHYISTTTTATYVSGQREGPDTEVGDVSGTNFYITPNGTAAFIPMGQSSGNYLYPPFLYHVQGDSNSRGIVSATYSSTLNPYDAELSASYTGTNPGLGPEATASGQISVSHIIDDNGTAYSVAQESRTLYINKDLTTSIAPVLFWLIGDTVNGANYSDSTGTITPFASQGVVYKMCNCAGSLIMSSGSSDTQVVEMQSPITYTSSSFNYGDIYTYNNGNYLQVIYNSANGTPLNAGDRVTFNYTYLLSASSVSMSRASAILDSVNASVSPVLGTPASYSDSLLKGQLYYYESKAWDFIQNSVIPNGWGKPWNIAYGYNTATSQYSLAHDNDSSMGAGFLLYAASLKAAQTGESQYYTIADDYANYFLQLEAEDVNEHSATASGRLAYAYNGGSNPISLCDGGATAPGMVTDCTSIDQMSTAIFGLWQYLNLDSSKILYGAQVKSLLTRAVDYVKKGGDGMVPNNALLNLHYLLGDGEGVSWQTTQSDFTMPGIEYTKWLNAQTANLNTGAAANNFYIDAMEDKLLAHKDPTKLADRYQSVINDSGLATAGYYPITRGTSYTNSWGYFDSEFPSVGMLKSVNDGLVYTGGNPSSYQLMVGGTRDEISGRMGEHSAVALWGALENSNCLMQVAGSDGPSCSSWSLNSLQTMIGLIQDDRGGITDGSVGTLGDNTGNLSTTEMTDLTGYFLTSMAYYHLLDTNTSNIVPADKYDYIQGVAENNGTTTVQYLGDGTITQKMLFPDSKKPIYGSGVYSSPTLTFDNTGSASQLSSGSDDLSVSLTSQKMVSGSLTQVPLSVVPSSGTVDITITKNQSDDVAWTMSSTGEPEVGFTLENMPANTTMNITRDGVLLQSALSDSSGKVSFNYSSGFSDHSVEVSVAPEGSSPSGGSSSPGSGSGACIAQFPGSMPQWLYAAIPLSTTTVELYFTDGSKPLDHYSLEYGTSSNKYTFGQQNIGGYGLRTYIVKDLSPNTNYYFRVGDANGCSPGPWSNEISALSSTIKSGQSNAIISTAVQPLGAVKPLNSPASSVEVKQGDSLWSIASGAIQSNNLNVNVIKEISQIIYDNKDEYPSLDKSSLLEVGWSLKIGNDASKTASVVPKNYDVSIKVVDKNGESVVGATVVIHSNLQSAVTDKNGVATFRNLEAGNHIVEVEYGDYKGWESLNLGGGVKQINVSLVVKPSGKSAPNLAGIMAVLGVVLGLGYLLFKRRTRR